MDSKTINLVLPSDLLARIEAAAKANYCSRSDYLRTAAVLRLNSQKIIDRPVTKPEDRPMTQQEEEKFLKDLVEQYS